MVGDGEYPTAARRPLNSVLDSTKFRSAFGYAPGDWKTGINRAVAEILRKQAEA